jgi:DNA-directed RNA polymerase subunit RPC12/RpoP
MGVFILKSRYDVGWLKNEIYNRLSGMECPLCSKQMCMGRVSDIEQTNALYCTHCNLRVAVALVVTEAP